MFFFESSVKWGLVEVFEKTEDIWGVYDWWSSRIGCSCGWSRCEAAAPCCQQAKTQTKSLSAADPRPSIGTLQAPTELSMFNISTCSRPICQPVGTRTHTQPHTTTHTLSLYKQTHLLQHPSSVIPIILSFFKWAGFFYLSPWCFHNPNQPLRSMCLLSGEIMHQVNDKLNFSLLNKGFKRITSCSFFYLLSSLFLSLPSLFPRKWTQVDNESIFLT